MNPTTIAEFILSNYNGINLIDTWGEKSFFYNPNNILKRGIYFCTIKEKDGANDRASHLDRDGVYRFNFGISKQTFISLFETIPKRPAKGGHIEGTYDFTKLDSLTPHPVYGWMSWVSILNPTENSWEQIHKLLDESYSLAYNKYHTKNKAPK